MNKFLITLAALLFTSPAFASLDHWTCSNESTVMYLALNTDDGNFVLWDDKGQFLAAAKFTDTVHTKEGLDVLIAELDSGVAVGIAKEKGGIVLGISKDTKTKTVKFHCT